MRTQTIKAQDVTPGDYIYNRGAASNAFHWVRVKTVKTAEATWTMEGGGERKGTCVIIETTDWSTTKHPEEGIAIQQRVET